MRRETVAGHDAADAGVRGERPAPVGIRVVGEREQPEPPCAQSRRSIAAMALRKTTGSLSRAGESGFSQRACGHGTRVRSTPAGPCGEPRKRRMSRVAARALSRVDDHQGRLAARMDLIAHRPQRAERIAPALDKIGDQPAPQMLQPPSPGMSSSTA